MKVFASLIAALLLILSTADASLEDTCKQVAQGGVGFDYNFCNTTLQAVPRSRSADNQGFALISANLAKANMTYNLNKAKELLGGKNVPPEIKNALGDCKDLYESSIDELDEAVGYINSHDKGGAMSQLSAVLTDVDTCMSAWAEGESPMAKENDDALKISSLALSTGSLLP